MAMNIFQIPPSLLANLVRRTLIADATSQSPTVHDSGRLDTISETNSGAILGTSTKGTGCALCNAPSFADVAEQRAHYRSDWHRYNVKAKLLNKPILGEKDFMGAVADLSDSISGSESSESDVDADSGSDDAVQTALKRARSHAARPESPSQDETTVIPRSPVQWFHSPPSTQIGIYAAVFPLKMDPANYIDEIKTMQMPASTSNSLASGDDLGGRLWTMFMIAGGHFAGMVVRVSSTPEHLNPNAKNKGKHKPPEYEVLMQKTFHRYTTRRKQGGSQSLNDNAKGNAKSAGATLRRYGEQALKDDIRALLAEWSSEIAASERIWIRANVLNKRIFYDYDKAPFDKNDERLRTFPFQTRRPTHTELLRCLNELIRAKISHFSEAELKEQDEAYLASLPKSKVQQPAKTAQPAPKEKNQPPRTILTKEQEEQRDHWRRLLEMTRKGRMESLTAFWDRVGESLGGIDAHIPMLEGLESAVGWTLLHVAAAAGQDAVVLWLLEEKGANPTRKVEQIEASTTEGASLTVTGAENGQTPYEVASNKAARDVFRRLAGAHPNQWDWLGEGRIPSILSKEQEEGQEEKRKTRRKGLKEKMKEREEKRGAVEQEDEAHPEPPKAMSSASSSGPQRLGGVSDAGTTIGLTPEMRNRIEREKRARAIEARMQRNNNP